MRKKSFWIAIGLLIIPVAIFYLLSSGVQNFKTLSILGPKTLAAGSKDTVYYQVPAYQLLDQTGNTITRATFSNSVYIANFFYSHCKTDCFTMNRRLSAVYEKYMEFSEVQFLTIALDTPALTTDALKAYAGRYKADPKIWHFAAVSRDSANTVLKGFMLPAQGEISVAVQPLHYPQLVLVDKQSRIRGIYDSDSEAAVEQLKDDLKVLLYEYHKP